MPASRSERQFPDGRVRGETTEITRRSVCRAMSGALLSTGGLPNRLNPWGSASAAEATPSPAGDDVVYSPDAAAKWLAEQQLPDGGFPGPTGSANVEATIDAVMAGYAVWYRWSRSDVLIEARHFLLAHGQAYAEAGPGQAARLTLAAITLSDNPQAFGGEGNDGGISDPYCAEIAQSGGVDVASALVAALEGPTSAPRPGLIGRNLHDHAYALLALSANPPLLLSEVPEAVIETLRATQTANGGWAADGSSDPDSADTVTTSLVLLAAVEWMRLHAPPIRRGLRYLRSMRVRDSGFAYSPAEPRVADAVSTSMAMQALLSTGEDPASPDWGSVPEALARFQTPSGGFRYLHGDDTPSLAATLQAVIPLADMYLPVRYTCESL